MKDQDRTMFHEEECDKLETLKDMEMLQIGKGTLVTMLVLAGTTLRALVRGSYSDDDQFEMYISILVLLLSFLLVVKVGLALYFKLKISKNKREEEDEEEEDNNDDYNEEEEEDYYYYYYDDDDEGTDED
ncbi:hypothetical protein K1719_024159 [Acacia pycnantha]|nr:hypothetical protein K1719_047440 [Acacia pycnantha]KAI9100797.1 hypothetical protein K1719_024159 [Acacia pycnantha]